MSDAKLARLVDLMLEAQGILEELLGASSSTAFKSPVSPPSTPVVQGMVGLPDVSLIKWTVGSGDQKYEARPDDPKAWGFVYKYDRDLRKPTEFVRDDCAQLVTYLQAHENKLVMGGYTYFISANGVFLNRTKP